MSTIACLAAFFGASACWGVIGYVLGLRRGYAKWMAVSSEVPTIIYHGLCSKCRGPDPLFDISIHGGPTTLMRKDGTIFDPDAALDAEIKGSK